MECRGCGRGVELPAGRRLGFAETCEGCGIDLHSCAHCAHHDPSAYNACREPSAERVADRERANRCEYFRPGAAAGGASGGASGEAATRERARADLDALFAKPGDRPARK